MTPICPNCLEKATKVTKNKKRLHQPQVIPVPGRQQSIINGSGNGEGVGKSTTNKKY